VDVKLVDVKLVDVKLVDVKLVDVKLVDVVRHSLWLCLTTSTNYTSNNLLRIKNQRLTVQF
jgi:hypothetical protein